MNLHYFSFRPESQANEHDIDLTRQASVNLTEEHLAPT